MHDDWKMTNFTINSLADLAAWSGNFATGLKGGDVIALCGDLGAGKTTTAGLLINSLCKNNDIVTSPTFNLVHTYPWQNNQLIWHFDLYRLKHLEEVYDLGLDDALQHGISIIEWPEIIMPLLPPHTMIINISFGANEGQREFSLQRKGG